MRRTLIAAHSVRLKLADRMDLSMETPTRPPVSMTKTGVGYYVSAPEGEPYAGRSFGKLKEAQAQYDAWRYVESRAREAAWMAENGIAPDDPD